MYQTGRANYDEKLTQGFGAVACTDSLLFLGHIGPNSKISVFKFEEGGKGVKFLGFLSPMVGTVKKFLLTKNDDKLICNTNCGYLYVWDVSKETIETLESLTNNPLYIDGYIPLVSRVTPTAVVEPKNSAEWTDIDLMYDDLVVGVEKWPELNVHLFDYKKGKKVASFMNLLGDNCDKKKCLRTVKADPQLVTEGDQVKGRWVAFGSECGSLHLVFVPSLDGDSVQKSEKLKVKTYSFDLLETLNVNSIAWRFRNKSSMNLTVICGCSDGTIRCCVLNSESDDLKMSKQATYFYSKASIAATVNRIVCVKDNKTGVPLLVGSCNMIGELGNFEFGDLATNCVFEGLYQKLLQDSSDDIVSFAKVQDFITDLSVSPSNDFVVLVSCNDNVYLCPENRENEDKPQWSKPIKLNWRSNEFLKFVNN